jgi:hypothetical protein
MAPAAHAADSASLALRPGVGCRASKAATLRPRGARSKRCLIATTTTARRPLVAGRVAVVKAGAGAKRLLWLAIGEIGCRRRARSRIRLAVCHDGPFERGIGARRSWRIAVKITGRTEPKAHR